MVGIPAVSHVLPSLEVVRELVARGHRVTYANDPAVAGLIEATGADFVPYSSVLPVADNDWPEDPIGAMGVFLDDAVQALPQLRAVYDRDPADLYLYDIGAYPARVLGETQGRPLLQLSPTYVGWEGTTRRSPRPCGSCRAPTPTWPGSPAGSPTAGRPPPMWRSSADRPRGPLR